MNELGMLIAIILFPGLIATIICDKITVHFKAWGPFKYAINTFVLGVSSYALLQVFSFIAGLFPAQIEFLPELAGQLDVWTIAKDADTPIELIEVFAAAVVAIPVAFIAAWTTNYKAFNKLADFLGVSRKYGDENLFSFFLNSDDIDWVYVRDFERDLTYEGRVHSYSETDHLQEILLYDVTVYGYEEPYTAPMVYLCREMGVFVIESIPADTLEYSDGD